MFKLLMICFFLLCLSLPILAQDVPPAHVTIPFARDSLVAISPDVSQMLVVEPDQTILIYDLIDYKHLVIVTVAFDSEDRGYIKWARWKEDSSLILFRTVSGLYLMDPVSGDIQTVYTAGFSDKTIGGIAFFEDQIVARVGTVPGEPSAREYEIYAWDADTLEQTLFLPAGDDCLRETPTDAFAADVVAVFRTTPCYRMLWSPDQTRYLFWTFWNSGSPDPIEVYDARTQTLLFELRHCAALDGNEDCEETANLQHVSWSPDGTRIVSLPEYGTDSIRVWDGKTGELLRTLTPPETEYGSPQEGVAWHGNMQLATWEPSGHILVWDVETGELIFDWFHEDNVVQGVRWIRNGQLAVTWGDGVPWSRVSGQIWDTRSGEKLALITDSALKDVVEEPDLGALYLIFSDRLDIWYLEDLVKAWDLEPGD